MSEKPIKSSTNAWFLSSSPLGPVALVFSPFSAATFRSSRLLSVPISFFQLLSTALRSSRFLFVLPSSSHSSTQHEGYANSFQNTTIDFCGRWCLQFYLLSSSFFILLISEEMVYQSGSTFACLHWTITHCLPVQCYLPSKRSQPFLLFVDIRYISREKAYKRVNRNRKSVNISIEVHLNISEAR